MIFMCEFYLYFNPMQYYVYMSLYKNQHQLTDPFLLTDLSYRGFYFHTSAPCFKTYHIIYLSQHQFIISPLAFYK